jgi:hypothetical protein
VAATRGATGAATGSAPPGEWVLLSYRLPREPSTPRITVWRKLERLGVARLGDGLVGLPADPRTREQVDWIADEVIESGGTATVWLARPASREQEQAIREAMQQARAAEYAALVTEARELRRLRPGPEERARLVRRLRDAYRRIEKRDFFPPAERDAAEAAIAALAGLAGQAATKQAGRTPT